MRARRTKRRHGAIAAHVATVVETVSEFLDRLSSHPQELLSPRLSGAKFHLLRRRGKLVRPAIVWLLGRSLEVPAERLLPFCLSIELLHNATLLHDDVIDGSRLRRHRPTANAIYDNTLSVLAGDALLANSVAQVASTGDVSAMQAISATLEDLVAGESCQYQLVGDAHDSIQLCIEVAELKTGTVFSFGSWLPAHLADLPADRQESFAAIGRYTGVSFQLIDDILDFEADEAGKSPLADWQEAKTNAVTAALLIVHPAGREPLRRLFASTGERTQEQCRQLLDEIFPEAAVRESVARVRELAEDYSALADYHARRVPSNEAGCLFEQLRSRLLTRRA